MKLDPAVEAAIELDNENPNKAIKILLNSLGSDFSDLYYGVDETSDMVEVKNSLCSQVSALLSSTEVSDAGNLISVLASAHSQSYGIDIVTIALAMGADSKLETAVVSDASMFVKVYPVIPEPTAPVLRGIELSMALLECLGSSTTAEDSFKQTFFTFANSALITKSLDEDLDGTISAVEATKMTDAAAENFMSMIESAVTTSTAFKDANLDADTQVSNQLLDQIKSAKDLIDSSEGGSVADRVRSYITGQK